MGDRRLRLWAPGCAVIIGVCFLVCAILVQWSPTARNYWYWLRSGRRAGPFSIYGKVIDQYGVPVPNFEMEFDYVLGTDNPLSLERSRPHELKEERRYVRTNEKGEFFFKSPILAASVAVGSRRLTNGDDEGRFWQGKINEGAWFWSVRQTWSPTKGTMKWVADPLFGGQGVVPDDPNTPLIYHVGRMGPPERMIEFHLRCNRSLNKANYPPHDPMDVLPADNDFSCCVNVLAGTCGREACADSDIEIRLQRVKLNVSGGEKEGTRVEVTGLNGAAVQMAKDPFLQEAPPNGYATNAILEPKSGYYAGIGNMQAYFQARGGNVYGRIAMDGNTIDIVANPRGQRNLNYGPGGSERSRIPLPVTLPFKEDVPTVDARKIWAYADPNKENTIIVEGEKGAVEPGAGVAVVNTSLSGHGRLPDSVIWHAFESSHADGTFHLVLSGKEGDPIQIKVSLSKNVTAQNGTLLYIDPSPDDRTVVLAPRWRLSDKGKQ